MKPTIKPIKTGLRIVYDNSSFVVFPLKDYAVYVPYTLSLKRTLAEYLEFIKAYKTPSKTKHNQFSWICACGIIHPHKKVVCFDCRERKEKHSSHYPVFDNPMDHFKYHR